MKIEINDSTTAADKADGGADWVDLWKLERERAIKDLLLIETDKRMYINQKKQLQALVSLLFELEFYKTNLSILDEKNLMKYISNRTKRKREENE